MLFVCFFYGSHYMSIAGWLGHLIHVSIICSLELWWVEQSLSGAWPAAVAEGKKRGESQSQSDRARKI